MTLHPIPAFRDNYIWTLADSQRRCIVVDPGEAAPTLAWLADNRMSLAAILVTHHHPDHVSGIAQIREQHPVTVYGHPGPVVPDAIDIANGEFFTIPGTDFRFLFMDVPGHTADHVAFYQEGNQDSPPLLFCGDTLFSGGCGRLFGLPPELMFGSLQKLRQLPMETRICCAHEYTLSNLAFARHWLPEDDALAKRQQQVQELRDKGHPSLPSTMGIELETNLFLRDQDPELIDALARETGHRPQTSLALFTLLRQLKDNF